MGRRGPNDRVPPACFDDPGLYADYAAGGGRRAACRDCTVAYQVEMLEADRCLPADAEVTPLGRIAAAAADANPAGDHTRR